MDLKSQAGLAGLLTGFAGSLQEIQEKRYQQQLANQRRSEVEQFQIGERENARQIQAETRQQAKEDAQEKYNQGMELAKTYSKDVTDITPDELMLRENELSGYNPHLATVYHQLYSAHQPKMAPDNMQAVEGGNIATWTEQYDKNPYSKTYLQRETDLKTGDPIRTNYKTVPSLEDNPNFTGQPGSQKKRLKSESMTLMKNNFDSLLGTKADYDQINEALIAQKSLAEVEKQQNGGVLTKETQTKLDNLGKQLQSYQDAHAKALSDMQGNIDNIIGNNADLKKAADLSDALKKQERDPDAYENAIRQAYTREGYKVGKTAYKINNEDFLAMKFKYESLFAKPFPVSDSGENKNQGATPAPKHSQPVSVVRKQYSASSNKTKLIYSDGSEKIVDGRQ